MVHSTSHTPTAEAKWPENLSQPPAREGTQPDSRQRGRLTHYILQNYKAVVRLLSHNIEFHVRRDILILDVCSGVC